MLSLRRKADQFLTLKQEREELTVFQLEAYLPEKLPEYRRLDHLRERAYKAGDWKQAVELGRKLELHLRSAAEELIPKLPKQIGTFHDELIATGKMHGFLAAPLAKYLKKETRSELDKKLKERSIKIYAGWTGLRCGISHDNIQYFATPLIFVPPGAVKMRHSGEIVKIPYPFWIGRNEVTHEDFSVLLKISPQRSPNANTPVERVAWNDILFYCFIKTRQWQESKLLPPGFIVRPPTEAEWEYAAGNAWLGPDRTPFPERAVFRDNSRGRTWPPGTRKPSLLGTDDMYGNVSEIVQPIRKPKMQNAVVIRGGSFRNREK